MIPTPVLEALAQTPLVKQLMQEHEAQELSRRRALRSEYDRARAVSSKAITRLAEVEREAGTEIEKAMAALRAAGQKLDDARAAARIADREVERLEIRLREDAPEAIATFQDEMGAIRSKVQASLDDSERSTISRLTGDPEKISARETYVQSISAAILEAGGLVLDALPRSELAERLDALRARVARAGLAA